MKRLAARWEMCWLLFLSRGVCQANRVLLGAVMPYLSAEMRLSSQEKGSILAAFSTGYMLTQVIGGTASDAFGGKLLVLFAITVMSLGSLAAGPLLGRGGLELFWCCYFVMGLAEGPSYPTTGSMLSKWIPAHERGAAMSIVDTGSSVASMLTFALAPLLAEAYGWRVAFHCFGGSSLLICGLWACVAANRPAESKRVSPEERAYLRDGGVPSEDVYGETATDAAFSEADTTTPPAAGGAVGAKNGGVGGHQLLHQLHHQTSGGGVLIANSNSNSNSSERHVVKVPNGAAVTSGSSPSARTTTTNAGATTGHRVTTTMTLTTTTVAKQQQHSFGGDQDADAATFQQRRKAPYTHHRKKEATFPFRLFCYAGAWAVVFAHAAFNFGRYFVYNSIVSFYVDVAGTTPVVAGRQVLFGQIADTLGKFLFAGTVDRAIERDASKKTFVRKVVSSSAFVVFAAAMVVMAHATAVPTLTVALVACKIASSAHVCGFKTTYLDLSSKHTGSLTGVSNTIATLSAMISPLATGFFLGRPNQTGHDGWRHMFFLIALVNVVASVAWSAFASADSLDDKIAPKGAA
mmetsp:Transcript_16112/g.52437  ORF Transcript_16112/g.52437 Transcript_16112/m.52437 type:complete len:576 (+) Transcript_16112:87-1814(+)